MIKKIAWETFKNTGDINSFMELKQIENIEKKIEENTEEQKIKIEPDTKKEDIKWLM